MPEQVHQLARPNLRLESLKLVREVACDRRDWYLERQRLDDHRYLLDGPCCCGPGGAAPPSGSLLTASPRTMLSDPRTVNLRGMRNLVMNARKMGGSARKRRRRGSPRSSRTATVRPKD